MRRILALLTAIAAVGSGFLFYQRANAPEPDYLRDCTPGYVHAPILEKTEPWPGQLRLEQVSDIVEGTSISGGYLTTRPGVVYLDGEVAWTEPDVLSAGAEQGLLDILVDESRGLIFTSLINGNGDLEFRSRPLSGGDDFQVWLTVEQPHEFHNGGDMELSPDGYVFVSLGDGGPSGDLYGHPQNLNTLLGSILRVDPSADGYAIPADNPTVDGEPVAQWAYGVRNSWRISVDTETGVLWFGDVGNWCIEEINAMPATGVAEPWNFGWSALEGTSRGKGDVPLDHVPPVIEYGRQDGGCAVVGGHVYRGGIDGLAGLYVFSDYCQARLLALDTSGGRVRVFDLGVQAGLVTSIEVVDGELMVLSQTDGVFKLR